MDVELGLDPDRHFLRVTRGDTRPESSSVGPPRHEVTEDPRRLVCEDASTNGERVLR